jgi:hypothetical protein
MNKTTTFFTTALALFGFIAIGNAQFTEDFETDLSAWSQQGATNDNGDEWTITTLRAQSGTQSVYFNDFQGDHDRYLLSSPQDLSAVTAPLLTFSENINWSSYGVTHQALYSTDYSGDVTTATWNILYDAIGTEDAWVEHAFSLPASANVTIAFHYIGNFAAEWYIDDVSVAEAPSCTAPDNLLASGITTSEANLSWNETGTATEWQVDYGTFGYTPPTNSTVTGDNPFSITGLAENTSYDIYLRAICGPGDTSEWVSPVAFTTACAPITGDVSNDAYVVASLPYSATGSTSTCYTDVIGNPNADVWYQYVVAPCTDSLIISLCGSDFDTYLRVYSADAVTQIYNNDDNASACGPGNNSHLAIDVTEDSIIPGDTIYILVEGYGSNTGTYNLNITDVSFLPSSSTDTQVACDSYTWDDGVEYTASNNTATLVIPNAAGCDSTITLDLTILSATFSTDEITTCESYTWIDGIEYTESNNTASFTIPNTAGCDSVVTLNLTINTVDASVTVVDDNTLKSNEASTGATYQWLDCEDNFAPIAGETNMIFTTQTSGEYAVKVTLNGCTEISDCFTITSTVGINDLDNTFKVELYPNPTLNSITFNIEGIDQLDMELLDINGKVLMQKNSLFDQDSINLSAFMTGTYFVRITTPKGSKEIRVVKK